MTVSTLGRIPGTDETPWAAHLRATDEALAQRNIRAAVRAWDEAHLAAVGSLRWDAMIEVGDAYLRIGRVSGLQETALATARRSYFAALFRACRKDSLEGILQTAEAFAALGDGQVVEECVSVAQALPADDPGTRARMVALRRRAAECSPTAPAPPASDVMARDGTHD